MKKILSVCLFSLLLLSNLRAQNIEKGLIRITPELLRQHIYYLASDSLMGRNTPSPGLDRAAEYIADEFASLGIEKVNGSWFQKVPLFTKNLDAGNCLLRISKGTGSKSFSLKTEYTPFEMTADTAVSAPVVFAGYGITAPEWGYDDYKDLDVKGKIVLVMKHEPGEKDSLSLFDGKKETRYSLLVTKIENAVKHGAAGLMLVTDPLNHMLLTPQGYPWPGLSKFLPQDNLPPELGRKDWGIPVVQVGETVIKYLLGSVDSLRNIQKQIDSSFKPLSFLIQQTGCEMATRLLITDLDTRNVVGWIEGRHRTRKNEYVVIGAHYDHVGYLKNHKEGEDFIFNGADDNASGTAGVMAIAKAFASMTKKPDRSVLFILFTGEEKGLFGSRYYCDAPLVPIGKTVVMLNLDMIARNGKDTLQIDGLQYNPDLAKLLMGEAEKLKFINIRSTEDLFKRSDHYNFFKKGISGVNITSGLHKDYHTVRDNPETIDPEKAALISNLTFKTAWEIANGKMYLKTEELK